MSHHEKHDKKHKKLQQLLQNRHNQITFDQAARARDLEQEREEEEEKKRSLAGASRNAARKSAGAEPVWSAKMQQIRDRNTGKMRDAKERWNRFAGTESGGGRGL